MSERVDESESNAYHSKGATFTGNSRYTGPKGTVDERPGEITSDSLASESLQSGGSFASNQSNVSASAQPAKGFTGNTTDTSGATILPSTSDARQRGTAGTTSTMDDYRTPADSRRQEESLRESGVGGASAAYDTSKGGPQESYGGTAPSYAQTMGGSGARSGGSENENPSYAPHGKSIQEGGFDSSAPNASFTTDIGGKNDPGRLAENQMSAGNARIGEDAGYPGANVGADGGRNQGGFERLSDDTNA